jgi:protein-tyrosine phosphatase
VERLVFVCKGNICRSAYAHAKVVATGFPSFSCGMTAQAGTPADPKAAFLAIERNVSLTRHRATQFSAFVARKGDLIVCMEPWQAKTVEASLANRGTPVTLLGLWSRPPRPWLFDPYGLQDCYWSTCFDLIDCGIEQMLRLIWQASKGPNCTP